MRAFLASVAAAALVASLPRVALGEGDYGSVPLRGDEQKLIDSANELEGYFRAQSLLYENAALVELARDIGTELAPEATDAYIDYRFFLLRDPSPNAFALPNGHIYVHTGMLARLQDESQLAALLGHELNHVAGHHGILGDRAATKRTVAAMVLGGLGGWGSVVSIGLQASVFGFSRELEQEADNRAAELLTASRFDPQALPEVFDILAQDYEGLMPRMPTVWSTHPEVRARAETARKLVEGLPTRPRDPTRYESLVLPLRLLTIRDYIQDDYPQTALALAESTLARYPSDAGLMHMVGDAWQAMGAQSRIDATQISESDKRSNRRERIRRTREQRLAEDLETPEGKAAYASNLANAEEHYRRALEADPQFAPAYRGLGEVYEQLERDRDAAAAYLQYVRAVPDGPDRALIVDRLRKLSERLKNRENGDGA